MWRQNDQTLQNILQCWNCCKYGRVLVVRQTSLKTRKKNVCHVVRCPASLTKPLDSNVTASLLPAAVNNVTAIIRGDPTENNHYNAEYVRNRWFNQFPCKPVLDMADSLEALLIDERRLTSEGSAIFTEPLLTRWSSPYFANSTATLSIHTPHPMTKWSVCYLPGLSRRKPHANAVATKTKPNKFID